MATKRKITDDSRFHPAERRLWSNQLLEARLLKTPAYEGGKERDMIVAELSARKHALKPPRRKKK
jgi:hypothetical protein